MTAREHAERASALLAGAARYEERLAEASMEDRLAMAAGGGIARANRDLEWTVSLAQAHALTSIALAFLPPAEVAALDSRRV
jgi:hypothetical protein